MSIRDRIKLAKVLGVAPDDIDYVSLVGPVAIATHIRENHQTDITDGEWGDLVLGVMTGRERDAYDRVIGVISKYGH